MNAEQLLEVTKGMKEEILYLLRNTNLSRDKEAQRTIKSINAMFDRLDVTVDEVIPEEVLKRYFFGTEEAKENLAKMFDDVKGVSYGLTTSNKIADMLSSHVHMMAVAEITDNLMLDLKSAIRTAKKTSNDSIERTLNTVKNELKGGVIRGNPRRVITKRVAQAFQDGGMTSFITIDGKRLPLDFYSEVTVRTNLKKANIDGAINRYVENGEDLVKISGNTPTCHHCYAHRGLIFSISGNDERFPSAKDNLPPYHPNCQCSASVWVIDYKTDEEIRDAIKKASTYNPNKDIRSDEQKKAYKLDQRKKAIRNQEKKEYANIKALLGDEAPKTLGGFRRMKRANTENYQRLKSDYQSDLKYMRSLKGARSMKP